LVKILQKCIFVLVVVEKGHDGRPRGGFFGQECHFLAAVEALLGALSGLRGAAAGTVVGRRQRRRNYRRQLRQQGVALRVRFSVAWGARGLRHWVVVVVRQLSAQLGLCALEGRAAGRQRGARGWRHVVQVHWCRHCGWRVHFDVGHLQNLHISVIFIPFQFSLEKKLTDKFLISYSWKIPILN